MAKARRKRPRSARRTISAERAARLYHLLQLLAAGPQTRDVLKKRLRLDVRGFYRDLELLRAAGITLPLRNRRYTLEDDVESAIANLSFPDPRLTLGEAMQLAQGRTPAHRKLRRQIEQIIR